MHRPPHRNFNNFNNAYQGPRPYHPRWRPTNSPRGFPPQPLRGWAPPQHQEHGNNEEHWCETCDRGFRTADLLDKHKQQHQKCNIDGCQFIAHPKVITKHIQMQHSSGLYKKIAKLNNPEEIQKWIDERKKKYPTRSHIEKKAAECKEKIDRGEKMAMKVNKNVRIDDNKSTEERNRLKRKNGFDNKTGNYGSNQQDFKRNKIFEKNNRQTVYQPTNKKAKPIPKVPVVVERNKLKPFEGILSIANFYDKIEVNQEIIEPSILPIEDDGFEEPVEQTISENHQEPVVCGALSSLMCDYGSSEEEIEEKDKDIVKKAPIATIEANSNENSKVVPPVEIIKKCDENNQEEVIKTDVIHKLPESKEIDDGNKSDDSGPEEVKVVKCNNTEPDTVEELKPESKIVKTISNRWNPREQRQHQRYKPKIPSTLLQKLLHKEIRHERNIVLQCIRYIRNNNYFDTSNK